MHRFCIIIFLKFNKTEPEQMVIRNRIDYGIVQPEILKAEI